MSALKEPNWLTITQIRMLHSESLQLFGGSHGVRDETLVVSALDRPRNKWHYEPEVSVFALAAAFGFGIAKNHGFIDGNKRTSLLAIRAFLFMNGYRFNPEEVETVTTLEGLASGSVDEETLAGWIQESSSKRT